MTAPSARVTVALPSLTPRRSTYNITKSMGYVIGRATRAEKTGQTRGKGEKGNSEHPFRSTPLKTAFSVVDQRAEGRATFFAKGRSPFMLCTLGFVADDATRKGCARSKQPPNPSCGSPFLASLRTDGRLRPRRWLLPPHPRRENAPVVKKPGLAAILAAPLAPWGHA